MVLDKLGSSLKDTISKIRNALFVDETLINELVKDVQRALLQADVQVQLVFEIAKSLKESLKNSKPPAGISQKEHLIHILYDELAQIMGGEAKKIEPVTIKENRPFKIMLVGLFGNGKTTTCGKLAKYYQKRGMKLAMISTDTWRPAAFEQLKQLGNQLGVPVFGNPALKDPVKVYQSFEPEFSKYDLIIIDTAGRDALNDELIKEIDAINKAVKPHETILTMNADIGQAAGKLAQTFHDTCNVTGVIISKLDGTAKGGGALTACKITGAKVMFIGVGEKIDDLEEFKPKNFVGQLLGMGDLEKLLQKASEAIKEEDAKDLSKRLLKGEFTLIDLYDQMQAMKKMGPLSKVMELIPGFSSVQMPKEALTVQEGKMETWKYIMDSCTKRELEEPLEITPSQLTRIAKGSGTSEQDVRELLKHYKQSKKLVKVFKGMGLSEASDEKQMSEKEMQKMMRKMGNMKNMMQGMTKR
ncbi:MAG TPA: signal recognition particle receptor subunit alpha [Acidobacteriota bacterium]|nr:signal recognition particle receptor subunit alpha [Acidobacteriota bacterium]